MHSTYGAYNYSYNHKTVMHIQIQALSIIYILSATTPLQIPSHERVKQDDPSKAICSRFINSHPWFWVGLLSQPSLCYSSSSWAFVNVGQLLFCVVGNNHRHESLDCWEGPILDRAELPREGQAVRSIGGKPVYLWTPSTVTLYGNLHLPNKSTNPSKGEILKN